MRSPGTAGPVVSDTGVATDRDAPVSDHPDDSSGRSCRQLRDVEFPHDASDSVIDYGAWVHDDGCDERPFLERLVSDLDRLARRLGFLPPAPRGTVNVLFADGELILLTPDELMDVAED